MNGVAACGLRTTRNPCPYL